MLKNFAKEYHFKRNTDWVFFKNGFKVPIIFDMFCASEVLFSFILLTEKVSTKWMNSLPYHLVPYML